MVLVTSCSGTHTRDGGAAGPAGAGGAAGWVAAWSKSDVGTAAAGGCSGAGAGGVVP
jgi:hypothetical protein